MNKLVAHAGVAALAAATVLAIGPAVADQDRNGYTGGTTKTDGDDGRKGDRGRDKLQVVGLSASGTQLFSFDTRKPGDVRNTVTVRGLTGGDTALVGIDYRVQDGALYGVGNNKAAAGVYRIDPATGTATLVLRLTVALDGTAFGVDFNPAANALRVVSDAGQNLRQPFAVAGAATVTDVALTYPPAPATATGITGAAYTNNDLDATSGTTLYDLDTTLDQIALQSPANNGTLAATGKLGVDAQGDTGFDIYSTVRGGKAVELFPYAVINNTLYDIELFNGVATAVGPVGTPVSDIAIPLDQL